MKKYYLAVDIGASSGRHMLACYDGGKITLEEIYRFENGFEKEGDSLIWDIDRLSHEVKEGIKKCKEAGRIPESVAIDTWGVDYVLLDEKGEAVKPVYAYRDMRTLSSAGEVEDMISFEALYARTGIQKQNFNTVYQLWCDKKSGKLQEARAFLMMPDYLAYTLTGEMRNEYTNASTTGMVNAVTRTWDPYIINTLGYPSGLFGELSVPGTSVGRFLPEVREYVGFDSTVVLCPTHDTASAVAGCPMGDDGIYVSSGTWSLIGRELSSPILTPESMTANFTNEGGIGYRFRYLKNYMGMWLFQNIRKNLGKKYTYDEMMCMAQESSCVEFFDVNDESLVAPDNMIDAIESLLGKSGMKTGDMLNCVYHSLAASYRSAALEIERLTGRHAGRIFIVGGGSRDAYLNRLTAEYTGKRIFTGLGEATAAGNIMSQIMADEGISLDKAREIVFKSFEISEVK